MIHHKMAMAMAESKKFAKAHESFEATFHMARVVRKMGDRGRARELLDGLASKNEGTLLRRVRGTLFFWSPTPAAAWRWLRALIAGR